MITENRARVLRARDHRAPRHESRHANRASRVLRLIPSSARASRKVARANPHVRVYRPTRGPGGWISPARTPTRRMILRIRSPVAARAARTSPPRAARSRGAQMSGTSPRDADATKGRAGASEHVHDPSRAARVVGSALTAPSSRPRFALPRDRSNRPPARASRPARGPIPWLSTRRSRDASPARLNPSPARAAPSAGGARARRRARVPPSGASRTSWIARRVWW